MTMDVPPASAAGPIQGGDLIRLRQGGRLVWVRADALCDWLMAVVEAAIGRAATPILAQIAAIRSDLSADDIRDAARDEALAIAREAVAKAVADLAAETSARAQAETVSQARFAALERASEEVVHFTCSAALPVISVVGGATLILIVAPVKAGDVLAAGEHVEVEPAGSVPGTMAVSSAEVTATNVVRLRLSSTVAITAGQIVTWKIVALR